MADQKLMDALREHQKSLKILESEVTDLEKSDFMQENRRLLDQVELLQATKKASDQQIRQLDAENQQMKRILREQLLNERTEIINKSEKRAELFFRQGKAFGTNRLRDLETQIVHRMQETQKAINIQQEEASHALLNELISFEAHVKQELLRIRTAALENTSTLTMQEKDQLEALRQEPLTDSQIEESSRKNNLELFIGQNLINKVGILLIVIGVIAASQYTLLRLPDFFKGMAIFLLGGLLLLGGELLNRRKANVVSLGITAGGIAVLYVGIAVSYFTLNILSTSPALLVCVLITAAAFFLSRRYESQTITSFALLGGYLPILVASGGTGSSSMLYGLMLYFILLNLLALLVGARRRWMVSAFLGFFLNLFASIYLSAAAVFLFWSTSYAPARPLLLCYLFFTFLVYTAVPIAAAYRSQKGFSIPEVILLAVNTVASSLILYLAFYALWLNSLMGLLAILFAASYLLLGRWVERRCHADKKASILFYLTGFAFVVLVIPFQFGSMWLSLGWLVEGLVLLLYGITKEVRIFKRAGAISCGLCVAAFLFFDLLLQVDHLFAWKYLALTLGSLLVLTTLIRKKESLGRGFYTLGVSINLWIYLLYLSYKGVTYFVHATSSGLIIDSHDLLVLSLWCAITVLLAYAYTHINALANAHLRGLSILLYSAVCLAVLYGNFFTSGSGLGISAQSLVFGAFLLLLLNACAILAMRTLLVQAVLRRKFDFSVYPLVISGFGLLLMTQVLVIQYDLSFASIILSLLYMLVAVLWVTFGFFKRSAALRRFGLTLSVFSVLKLFLVDLSSLATGYRIVSYFALGGSLVVISLLYQYFIKRFELKEVKQIDA